MPKSGLTEADWQRIEGLFKPIIERLEAIENCPTIKNELKK